jgi:hypothetical protein
MIATLWRIPSLVQIYRTMRAKSAARTPGLALWVRSQVGWLFVAWLQDIPFIPLFVITLPFVWRSRALIGTCARFVPSTAHGTHDTHTRHTLHTALCQY